MILERGSRQGQLSVTELDGLRALGLELLRRADRDLGSAPWRAVRKLVQPLDDAQLVELAYFLAHQR